MPDEAEFAAHSGAMCRNDIEVGPAFRRNPEGRGQPLLVSRGRLRFLSPLLAPRIRKNRLPATTAPKLRSGCARVAPKALSAVKRCSSLLSLIVTLLLAAMPAIALDPARQISQYAHTAWRTQDGEF